VGQARDPARHQHRDRPPTPRLFFPVKADRVKDMGSAAVGLAPLLAAAAWLLALAERLGLM
jgi:hypothetical protein